MSTPTPSTTTEITWDPPGPGSWELETVHVTGSQPLLFQRLGAEAFSDGFREFASIYGAPLDAMVVQFVNDHLYMQLRGVGEPPPKPGKTSKAPPDIVLKVVSRLHPEFRRRNRTARSVLEQRTWVVERDRWYGTWRDEMLTTNRALQREPIESSTDAQLLDHTARVSAHMVKGISLHFRLIPVCDLPVGRFIVACRTWGIAEADALALMAGSSPASMASAEKVARIAAACEHAGVVPSTLDEVCAASPEAAAELQAYLDDHGWRAVTQYSPRGLTLHELPNVVVGAIVTAGEAGRDPRSAPDSHEAELRTRVPEQDRPRFDELLADARAGYGTRDDNVTLTFLWPVGLLRRALLEIGRRLAERGTIDEPDHVMTLELDEMTAALSAVDGEQTTWRDLARTRHTRMAAADASQPPLRLGPPESPPPDFSLLPRAMAEVTGAIMSMLTLETAHDGKTTWSGAGTGIGSRAFTGKACVATDPQDALARLEPGDVLVTSHTTPAYEAVLPIVGAVVTDHGGLTSHAALVARELGLPAVLGVIGATTTIPDGATVTVDPIVGRVTIV